MSQEKLQQAISMIKAGNKQAGQKLLGEVLTENPKNEQAWLWMSTLVPLDKQIFCLEKALSINPANMQARDQLMRLKQRASAPVSQPVPEKVPAKEAVVRESRVMDEAVQTQTPVMQPVANAPITVPRPRVWTKKNKYGADVIMLDETHLVSFSVTQEKLPALLHILNERAPAGETLRKMEKPIRPIHISLDRITSVRELYGILTIQYKDTAGKDAKASVTTPDKQTAEIMQALQHGLGEQFRSVAKPTKMMNVLLPVSALFLIACTCTGFFYWLANGLAAEQPDIHGSATARGLGNLLLLIGPNGVLCIGGVALLILLAVLVANIAKPPTETTLVRSVTTQ